MFALFFVEVEDFRPEVDRGVESRLPEECGLSGEPQVVRRYLEVFRKLNRGLQLAIQTCSYVFTFSQPELPACTRYLTFSQFLNMMAPWQGPMYKLH